VNPDLCCLGITISQFGKRREKRVLRRKQTNVAWQSRASAGPHHPDEVLSEVLKNCRSTAIAANSGKTAKKIALM
jgi:hypothetical protein